MYKHKCPTCKKGFIRIGHLHTHLNKKNKCQLIDGACLTQQNQSELVHTTAPINNFGPTCAHMTAPMDYFGPTSAHMTAPMDGLVHQVTPLQYVSKNEHMEIATVNVPLHMPNVVSQNQSPNVNQPLQESQTNQPSLVQNVNQIWPMLDNNQQNEFLKILAINFVNPVQSQTIQSSNTVQTIKNDYKCDHCYKTFGKKYVLMRHVEKNCKALKQHSKNVLPTVETVLNNTSLIQNCNEVNILTSEQNHKDDNDLLISNHSESIKLTIDEQKDSLESDLNTELLITEYIPINEQKDSLESDLNTELLITEHIPINEQKESDLLSIENFINYTEVPNKEDYGKLFEDFNSNSDTQPIAIEIGDSITVNNANNTMTNSNNNINVNNIQHNYKQ